MEIRDRIKELRRVKASELVPNPKNWRTHPAHQQDGLRVMLSKVGYADAVIARELDDGKLMLIDGHLRAETTPDSNVPVLVTDLTEVEADEVLATLDPLASLADTDVESLAELMKGIDSDNEQLNTLLQDISDNYNIGLSELIEQETDADYVEPDPRLLNHESRVPEGLRALVLHLEQTKYDKFMEDIYDLSENWDIMNVADVIYEAVQRAKNDIT